MPESSGQESRHKEKVGGSRVEGLGFRGGGGYEPLPIAPSTYLQFWRYLRTRGDISAKL